MKTSYLILTLFTIFVTSAPAKEANYIQMSILDNDCVFVDMDIDFGSLPATEQVNYDSYLSFCDGYGSYKILRDGLENNFLISLDYKNQEIKIYNEPKTFGPNVAWVFDDKSQTGINPIALMYSIYEDVLIDSQNNVWEPQETIVIVALKGPQSCVVAELKENEGKIMSWADTLKLALDAKNMRCLN